MKAEFKVYTYPKVRNKVEKGVPDVHVLQTPISLQAEEWFKEYARKAKAR